LSDRRWPLIIAILLGLAACGPIPKPFQEAPAAKELNPLLEIPDGAGVTVFPVAGAPAELAGPLTEALVLELQRAEVPASASAALTNALLMKGTSRWQAGDAIIDWILTDPDGKTVTTVQARIKANLGDYRLGNPALVQALAEHGAALVAAALRPEASLVLDQGPRRVAVVGVEGAPGDGDRALARAMTGVLAEAGIEMAPNLDEAALLLAGAVSIAPMQNGMEEVTISWWLMDNEGTVLGTLEQANAVPAGSLSDRWGPAAYDAALANVDAIREILARLDEIRALQPVP